MSNLEFVRKLYNGKNCYSDHMQGLFITEDELSEYVEGYVNKQ